MGRVAIDGDGVVIDEARFPGRQGRLLFAYLVAEQGRAVPRDELAAALWEDVPPVTWEKGLSVLVSKLRGLLGDAGTDGAKALTSAFGCYRLDLPEGSWVDVSVAANAVDEAEEALARGESKQAKTAAEVALAIARQRFLPGEDGAWVEEKRRDLADVRGRALSALAEACLRSGDTANAAKSAEQAITLAPFHEVGYRRLMEAHAAAGNRAEALRVYERCRRLLAEELGAYPSPETESIYRELLEVPAPPAGAATSAEEPFNGETSLRDPESMLGPRAPPRVRGRPLLIGLACGAIAVAAIAAVVLLPRGSPDPTAAASASSGAVGIFNADSGRSSGQIPVGQSPSALTVGSGSIWVTNADGHSVSRIDPVTNAVVETIPVGSSPGGIATGAGAVWVTNSLDGTVSRIDPGTSTAVQTIDVGNQPLGIVYAAGSIWVANTGDATITRIDAESGKPIKMLAIAATELAFGAGTLWASERAAGRVVRLDPATGKQVATTKVGNGPTGIAFGDGAAWVANSLDGTVSRIDPDTNSVTATVLTGNGPTAVTVDPRGVWVSNQFDGGLARIDPRTGQVAQRVSVGSLPQGVAMSGANVLVAVRQSGAGHRGGTLEVRMTDPVDSIDTAVAYSTTSWPILRMTNDGLVAYNHASGLAGTQLVPDLAVALPAPTDGSRTYVFRLRPNIRYSNRRPLKASDFRATFERDFEIGKLFGQYYDGIIGAARCEKDRRHCDLSRGIVADDVARTVTFHLVAPDAEFLYKLALNFAYVTPAGTPSSEARTHPLPATGPYMIAGYRRKHTLRFVRNPYFHEWSKAAQPDGYPDEIVFEMGGSVAAAVNAVIHGKADAYSTSSTVNPPPAGVLEMLRLRYASQVRANPQPHTTALFLNTRVAPFNSLDARRALNYAADRAAAVLLVGGPNAAQKTCQILPAGFPGYHRYCPYGSAKNLAKARALVARSGTRGMKVTYWSNSNFKSFAPYAVKLLRSLGYRVTTKIPPADSYYAVVGDSRTAAQIGLTDWIPDYPAASAFVDPLLSCASFLPGSKDNLNVAEFCNAGLDRRIGRALSAQVTDPYAARGLWERADKQIVDAAPWVPLVNPKTVDVLSNRVGNYQYSPNGLGVLFDQLWVR